MGGEGAAVVRHQVHSLVAQPGVGKIAVDERKNGRFDIHAVQRRNTVVQETPGRLPYTHADDQHVLRIGVQQGGQMGSHDLVALGINALPQVVDFQAHDALDVDRRQGGAVAFDVVQQAAVVAQESSGQFGAQQ